MDMPSFFPSDAMANLLSTQNAPHVSFRAGILNRDATTNRVTPDPRKGTFQIVTTPEDRLMHLQWRPRNTPSVEHDLILFNGETELKQVVSCPASARVYVLKWKDADTRMFFWMQGPDASQDTAHVATVNNILDHGPDHQQPTTIAPAAESTPPLTASPPHLPTAAAPEQSTQPHADEQMTTPAPDTEQPVQSSTQPRGQITIDQLRSAIPLNELVRKTPTISNMLQFDTLQPYLENPRVLALLPGVLQHLPQPDRSLTGLKDVLRSPPLRAQAVSLTKVLQNDAAADMLRSFGLETDQPPSPYSLKTFVDALSTYQKRSNPDQ